MNNTPTTPLVSERPDSPRGRVSFEEFLASSDEGSWAEWVDGEIVPMSPASLEHQRLLRFLLDLLGWFTDSRGLGEVIFAPFVMKLASRPSGREPDLLFVATANRERLRETHLDGPADLVVEIVSPESEERDRGAKFVEYEAGGVPEYWLVDPTRQEAYFYQRGADGLYHLRPLDAEGRYYSGVLSGFWLRPTWLWQRPLPAVGTIRAEIEA
jgi:Uma2 family endonuclease